jgi:hypothetical protein
MTEASASERNRALNPLEQRIIDIFQDNPGMEQFKDSRGEGLYRASRGDVLTRGGLPDDHRQLRVVIWSNPPRLGECEINIGKVTGDNSGSVRTIQAQRRSYGGEHDLVFRDIVTTVTSVKDAEGNSGRREERTVINWKAITEENIDDVLEMLRKEGIEPFL